MPEKNLSSFNKYVLFYSTCLSIHLPVRMSSCVKHLHQEPLLVTPRRAFKTDAFMQRNLYIHTDAPHTKTFAHKILASEKPLHRAAFIDRRLYTHTQSFYTAKPLHTQMLSQNAHERFYAQKLLHAEMFDTEKRFHRAAFAHTYGSFFAHGSFYTLMSLHRAACTRRSFCTRKPLHRSFLTEKPFHREAFLDRGFHT